MAVSPPAARPARGHGREQVTRGRSRRRVADSLNFDCRRQLSYQTRRHLIFFFVNFLIDR